MLGLNPGLLQLWHWQSDAPTTRLDLIHFFLDLDSASDLLGIYAGICAEPLVNHFPICTGTVPEYSCSPASLSSPGQDRIWRGGREPRPLG
jgi:hypothetical protein